MYFIHRNTLYLIELISTILSDLKNNEYKLFKNQYCPIERHQHILFYIKSIIYFLLLEKHSVCIIYLILARPSLHLCPVYLKCPPWCDSMHISVQCYVSHSTVVPNTVPRRGKIAQTICRLATKTFLKTFTVFEKEQRYIIWKLNAKSLSTEL